MRFRLFGMAMLSWTTLALSLHAVAGTQVVTNLNDSGAGSLRAAISAAAAGDTVVFTPGLSGTIALSGGTLTLTRNIVIAGNPGIVLDGKDLVRVMIVNAGVQAALSDLTLQHGLADNGAGIYNAGGVLTLSRCALRNNHATTSGGGLYVAGGSYSLTDTLVADNVAADQGGGIVDQGSQPSTIAGSRFTGNVAVAAGGAIRHVSGQPLAIDLTQVIGNQATSTVSSTGGGIASQGGVLTIQRSTLSGNTAVFGGGVYVPNLGTPSTLNLTDSLVAGNGAFKDGGGMFVFGATAFVTNSTFANNLAATGTSGGIGIQSSSSGTATVTLTNVTVAFNRAVSSGGGIAVISGTLKLGNSIVAGNVSATNPDLFGNFASAGYNLVQNRGTSTGYIATDLPNASNPNLAFLGYNGGPTNTLLPQSGSAAIDVIPASACSANGIVTDQRGYARPAGSCDVGAVEFGGTPPAAPPAVAASASRKVHGGSGTFDLPLGP